MSLSLTQHDGCYTKLKGPDLISRLRIIRIMLILKILNTTPQIFIHLNLVDDP